MISIIGAGPVGNYLGYLLSKNGQDVRIYEEHKVIGKPVHCTGIVTNALNDIVKLSEDFVVNKVDRIVIRGDNEVELKIKENFILDREKFDKHLFEMAKESGVKFSLGKSFKSFEDGVMRIDDECVKTDVLIGADGALSKVSKSVFGFDREYVLGFQARVKGNFDKNLAEVYLNYGNFLWVVPESEKIARIGIVDKKDVKSILSKFLNDKEVIEWQGGLIPIFNPRFKLQKENTYLVGDAGGMVKALSHGGIVQGLIGAQELSKSILNNEDYEKLWRNKLERDLVLSLRLRRILDKFNENDYRELIELCKSEKVREMLENRDYVSKYFWKLIIKEPRFLRFLIKVI